MFKYFIYILFFLSLRVNAQSPPPLPEFIDEQAQFPGGQKAFSDFINSNLKYPNVAKEKKNIGSCGVSFRVEVDGTIKDIAIIKSIEGCLECDKEAKRLFSIMPKWKPAMNKGKAIAVVLAIPIDFSIDHSENIQKLEIEKEPIFTVVEEMPQFPGGETAKIKFIQKNLVFPVSAIKNNTYGKCFLKFIVNKDGLISDISILKGVTNCSECDEEAKRVISIMPNWIPGKQNGRQVAVFYNIPFNFQPR
ncbi:MAG: energy transducer TonB [Bacteroidia bacterium]|nr:energy transducer TonB [Bacteroidia bacterium]